MFSVIFEVLTKDDKFDSYFSLAKSLKPEVERTVGFIDYVRYRSLTRDGWRLSLSTWSDEKALIRWRTMAKHHNAQALGRDKLLSDYHLRVGQNTHDTHPPADQKIIDQRLDATETGHDTWATLSTLLCSSDWIRSTAALDVARVFGANIEDQHGIVSWDVFENLAQAGEVLLLCGWIDESAALKFEEAIPKAGNSGARLRQVRVVRDYGMFDRREAPPYYPDPEGREMTN